VLVILSYTSYFTRVPELTAASTVRLAVASALPIVFAALGTVIGSSLQNMQGFQLIMNFLVMPIFFLSGALYPLSNLPKALAAVTRINPLTYGVDGLRGAFIGTAHFAPATNVIVLMGVAVAFLALGARAFAKIQI